MLKNLNKNKEINKAFVRCFNTADGKKVMLYLNEFIMKSYLSPSANVDELRHLQGQRFLVDMIEKMADFNRLK